MRRALTTVLVTAAVAAGGYAVWTHGGSEALDAAMTPAVAGPAPVTVADKTLMIPVGTVDPIEAPLQLATFTVEQQMPRQQGPFGVAMPVMLTFDQAIPADERDEVAKHAWVASTPQVTGAWTWISDTTMVFRPQEFWPGHATVDYGIDLEGLNVNDRYGTGAVRGHFTTGTRRIINVNGATHQGVVTEDGATVKSFPVSLGQPGWETRSGVKMIMDKFTDMTFTNEQIGAEEDYELTADDSIQINFSGEFIHSAPWAMSRIGVRNGSHGCTNVSNADADWIAHHVTYGDPVVYSNTGRPADAAFNGYGDFWNWSWSRWVSGGSGEVTTLAAPPAKG